MNENQNDFNTKDIYFKDAFTKTEDKLNLQVNEANIDCIKSNNNKFNLDSEGNLIVNSITSNDESHVGKTIRLTSNDTQALPSNVRKQVNFQVLHEDSDDTTGLLKKVGSNVVIENGVTNVLVEGNFQATPNTRLYIYILHNDAYAKGLQYSGCTSIGISKVIKVKKGDIISLHAYSSGVDATISNSTAAWKSFDVTILN